MAKAVNKKSYHNLRFERKFIFPDIPLEDLIATSLLTNDFCFTEIYERRAVNNIYLDDNNLSLYSQNVSGDGQRQKYRLRWYGDVFSEISNPTLEIKKKFGDVGDKVSFKLNNFRFTLDKLTVDQVHRKLLNEIKKNEHPLLFSKISNLTPTLYNSYERRYFLSQCEKFRITLDYNMKFYNPRITNYRSTEMTLPEIVLELKYNTKHDNESRKLSQQINSRLSKNSKYVRGIEITSF